MSNSANGPHRPSVISTIYSDDEGRTWQRGEIIPTPGLVHPSETAIAQVGGAVVLNIRHEGEPHQRAVVTGRDGATKWGEVRFDPALPEPVCMASLVTVGQPGARPDLLLFCNPHNPDGRERRNLTVKASTDQGKTWVGSQTLEPGPSGYSDMADVTRGQVLCLYECKGTLTLVRFGVWSLEPRRR
jgi:sialidase-1